MNSDRTKKTLRSRPPPKAARSPSLVPVVAICASAGGLDAFKELLGKLSNSTGKAFVLIQHLDPTHRSHLPELLSPSTKMPVAEVRIKTRIQANHVYVIASDRNLTLAKGNLLPIRRAKIGRNEPIDTFLAALAKARRKRAGGI
jgi:two-component system CheB/CheR fusion protein